MCGNNPIPKSQRLPKTAQHGQIPAWNNELKIWGAKSIVTPVLFQELSTLISQSKLVSGTVYRITDYQTKHKITTSVPASINTGVIEPLIVLAVSSNKIHTQAYSNDNPYDIINYDVADVLCEDGLTPRTGKIIYRLNTKKNISCYYDWLNVKHRRYKVDTSQHTVHNPTIPYNRYTLVIYNDVLWVSTVPGNIGHTPGTDNYWCRVLANISTTYHLYDITCNFGNFTIKGNPSDFKDYYTFHNVATSSLYMGSKVYTTHIGACGVYAASADPYNGIVIQAADDTCWIYGNTIGEECRRMNFTLPIGKSFYANNLTTGIFEIIGRDFYNNTLWNSSGRLLFQTAANAFIGFYGQSVFGDTCNTFSSQYALNNIFIGNNVNVNIFGQFRDAAIGLGNSRLFITRPQGAIYILGDNTQSGLYIGSHFGNYTLTNTTLSSSDSSINLFFSKTFTGAAGNGAVGNVTIDSMAVPNGFRIAEITLYQTGVPENTTVLNLGFSGSPSAGLNNTTGLMANIAQSYITRISPLTPESSSNTNILTLSIAGNAITAGTIRFHIHLALIL